MTGYFKTALFAAMVLVQNPMIGVWAQEAGHGAHAAHENWTQYPLIEPLPGFGRGGKKVQLVGLAASEAHIFPSGDMDGDFRTIPIENGKFTAKSPGPKIGGYAFLTARDEVGTRVTVASTVIYFSNPGPAPRTMLDRAKSEFEITPYPLPREHNHFREGEEGIFQVRFLGRPLAGKGVVFSTSNGTTENVASDQDGLVRIVFPEDFPKKPQMAGSHGRSSAKFILTADHEDGNRHYQTTFNYDYAPGAYYGKSLVAGVGFFALGMVIAAPLLRRRKDDVEKGKKQ